MCCTKEVINKIRKSNVVESSFSKDRSNLTQRCKLFTTASAYTQVAVLPWRYNAEMGTANSLHASA